MIEYGAIPYIYPKLFETENGIFLGMGVCLVFKFQNFLSFYMFNYFDLRTN